jgi:hypothetical protein|tara:strand:+ start:5771 stop:5959 length:189 start_codon:yes stop_codon:yes gene_type:complete
MLWVLLITLMTINGNNVTHIQEPYFNKTSCEMASVVVKQHAKKLRRVEAVTTCLEIDESDPE